MSSAPIVIASVQRSGSSWLGKIFDASRQTLYRFSPFHPKHGMLGDLPWIIPKRDLERDGDLLDAVRRMREGQTPWMQKAPVFSKASRAELRLVIKTVRSQFRLPWMYRVLGRPKIVFLMRNPYGQFNSLREVSRQNPGGFPEFGDMSKFEAMAAHPETARYLPDTLQELARMSVPRREALCWLAQNRYVLDSFSDNPDFTTVLYENLCQDPMREARRLYRFAGIPMDSQVLGFLRESTSMSKDRHKFSVHRLPVAAMERWRGSLTAEDRREIGLAVVEDPIMERWDDYLHRPRKVAPPSVGERMRANVRYYARRVLEKTSMGLLNLA